MQISEENMKFMKARVAKTNHCTCEREEPRNCFPLQIF